MTRKIVSLQSNVLTGIVGNQAARPVYEALNLSVSFVNTVCFSGIVSRNTFGMVFDSKEGLNFLENALKMLNEQGKCEILHCGFFGSAKQIHLLESLLEKKEISPNVLFVDPVIGDDGFAYVGEDIVKAYPSLLNHAHIITPNLFEFEVLSGKKISSSKDLIPAADKIFSASQNLETIIVTSAPADSRMASICILERGERASQMFTLKSMGKGYSGTGDMFSSLCCGHYATGYEWIMAAKMALIQTWLVVSLSRREGKKEIAIQEYLPGILEKYSEDLDIFMIEEVLENLT